jgi:hypothetical protein
MYDLDSAAAHVHGADATVSGQLANPTSLPSDALELSIVMPCLNEAETLAVCLRKARRFIEPTASAASPRR